MSGLSMVRVRGRNEASLMHPLRWIFALAVAGPLGWVTGARAEDVTTPQGTSLVALAGVRRIAVVIGANAPIEGRTPLRFAHEDADAVAHVLTEVGRFRTEDVHLLLDPDPLRVELELERALEAARAHPEPTLLLFYYSGHADGGAFYPSGRRLPLERLRAKLEDRRATVRLGIVDACRGGDWTAAKGLSTSPPFELHPPLALEGEGSILIASSSGQESAHEADAVRASIFTHHLLAGLRGAADAGNDGVVTVSEAFSYARELTSRDAAILGRVPQHPSFQMNLKGRQDLILAEVASAPSVVSIAQEDGPLEIVHLGLGTKLAELRAGRRHVQLALPPGRYMIQRRVREGAWAREFELASGQTLAVAEGDLELRGLESLVAKGQEVRPRTAHTTVPALGFSLRSALGVSHRPSSTPGLLISGFDAERTPSASNAPLTRKWVLNMGFAAGLTDRLQLVGPGLLAYRMGTENAVEWTPWGGLSQLGVGYAGGLGTFVRYGFVAGLDTRFWMGPTASIGATLFLESQGLWASRGADTPLDTWRSSLRVVYSRTLRELVTLNVGVGAAAHALFRGELPQRETFDPSLLIGAVGIRGGMPLPLIELHLTRSLSLDGWASVAMSRDAGVTETYMLGATISW